MKINWGAIGRFIKRWGPPAAEAVLSKRAMDKAKREAEKDAASSRR